MCLNLNLDLVPPPHLEPEHPPRDRQENEEGATVKGAVSRERGHRNRDQREQGHRNQDQRERDRDPLCN